MGVFENLRWELVVFPIVLLVFDVIFKGIIFKYLPSDTMADVSLAALTFNGVHLLVGSGREASSTPWGVVVFLLVGGTAVWFFCLLAAKHFKDKKSVLLILLSYVAGIAWFTWSTSMMLHAVP